MFNKILMLLALITLTITSTMAMDPIRVAGQSSSTNIKNVTLDLTIRVYDAANTEIYHIGVPSIYFDNESAFSFVWGAPTLTYNPLYVMKLENAANGTILFESRLDKIVAAQTQYRAYVDPYEINGTPTAGLILTSNGVTSDWGIGGGGAGTVTSVSVVTANGVSGTVATATTTPAITLTLGNIVPTSVNGYKLPIADGTSGQVLTTNGALQTSWTTVSGGGGGGGGASWLLGGNLGTTPPDMFLGTLDAQDVVFKLNSTIAGTIGTDNNTSLGLNSMHNVVTSGNNTGMGAEALYTLTGGTENTAVGYQSMYSNSTGNYNTGVGTKAMYSNGAGMHNTAVGFAALYSNGGGLFNTATGAYALHENTTGSWNTADGYNALYNNSSGAYNTAIGREAMFFNTVGDANVAVGYTAGKFKADGSTSMTSALNSVYIGNGAKGAMAANTNEIAIGYNAIGAGSNTVVLGNTDITILKCKGAYTATTGNAPNVFVASDGQIMRSTGGATALSYAVVADNLLLDECTANVIYYTDPQHDPITSGGGNGQLRNGTDGEVLYIINGDVATSVDICGKTVTFGKMVVLIWAGSGTGSWRACM